MNPKSFSSLGLCPDALAAAARLGWSVPTPVQETTIPRAVRGEDVAGMAETGSGKTGAYLLPLLHRLLAAGSPPLFAVVLAPTRELVQQVADVLRSLSSGLRVTCATAYGGTDDVAQMAALARQPHVVVATPGRLAQLLSDARGFSLSSVQMVVVDEADQMAGVSFYDDIRVIVHAASRDRQLLLFSATMPQSVERLAALSLRDSSLVRVSARGSVPQSLRELVLPVRAERKDAALAAVLAAYGELSAIVFAATCRAAEIVTGALVRAGFSARGAHGKMAQDAREAEIAAFRAGEARVLVSTNVAARGIDIPNVDLVVNYDLPATPKEYIHRCGRAGRNSRAGVAVTMVTQEDRAQYMEIERYIHRRLECMELESGEIEKWVVKIRRCRDEAVAKYKVDSRMRKSQKGG